MVGQQRRLCSICGSGCAPLTAAELCSVWKDVSLLSVLAGSCVCFEVSRVTRGTVNARGSGFGTTSQHVVTGNTAQMTSADSPHLALFLALFRSLFIHTL